VDEHSYQALGSLKVHRQDLEAKVLRTCVGTTLGASASTIFTEVKVWALRDLNLIGLMVGLTIDGVRYEVAPVKDLSQWILVEDIIDEHRRKNQRDTPLGPLSLVEEIEAGIYREGHHQPRWIACEVPLAFMTEQQLSRMSLTFKDKRGVAKREVIDEMPKEPCRVIDAAFRTHAGG